MVAGNGLLLYPLLGFASCAAFIYMSLGDLRSQFQQPSMGFVERNGTQFIVDGKAFYVNGWNSYWLMYQAVEEFNRPRVRTMLQAGAKMGLTVCRTWAFNDGTHHALQTSPGRFDNHVFKAILTRKNTLTGIEYRDDPTIFAWELMNEPRCTSDPSGDTLQDWIEEMAKFVKSIDKNHLLTVGLEGFYGPTTPGKLSSNPGEWANSIGCDFIRNSKIPEIDFTSVHVYPDHWIAEPELEDQVKFIHKWMSSHIRDGDRELNKPVLFAEFGLSNENKNFQPSHRDTFYRAIFDIIYKSAKENRSGAGAMVWQFMVGGMDEFNDDYGIVPWERPSMYTLITEQSCRLAALRQGHDQSKGRWRELC